MSSGGGNKAIVAALAANLGIAVTKFVRVRPDRVELDAGRGRSTRSPTPATRCCCWSAASGRSAAPRPSTRSASAASGTSTASSSRSCCSRSAACSRSTRRTTSGTSRTASTPGSGCRSSCCWPRSGWSRSRSGRRSTSPTRCAADQRWVQFVRTAKAPELPVVLLEDLAALVGLVFALFGVSHDAGHRQRSLGRGRGRR